MPTGKHTFIEREVKAIFDSEWTVIKLDEHRYYKRLSGSGINGIDFLAVHPVFGVALIEMKNYTKGKKSIPKDLDLKMLEKRNDTIRLINIIIAYYQRQAYFRLLMFIGWEYLYPKEWMIWLNAKYHIDNENVFFLGIVDY
jgi:hypothetical protein